MIVIPFENCSDDNVLGEKTIIGVRHAVLHTDVFTARVQGIKMIEIGQGTAHQKKSAFVQLEAHKMTIPEKVRATTHLEPDDYPSLARSLYFIHFNYRSISGLDAPHDFLVYLQGIICGLLQEDLVRYCTNVGPAIGKSRGGLIAKVAFRDEVATELLGRGG